MHRDLKSKLNLLFLNSKHYKQLDEEKLRKYSVVFMLTEIVGIWIGKLITDLSCIQMRLFLY